MSARLSLILKAARQLGLPSLSSYARYQAGLRSGFYLRMTSAPPREPAGPFHPILELPSRPILSAVLGEHTSLLVEEADEIVQGKARFFGNEAISLQLAPAGKLAHWTAYERGKKAYGLTDIKFLWEPARFGWAFTLGRAYLLTENETYPQTFWKQAEIFLATNPTYQGPNWSSGQEVALRLIAFVFALQAFAPSPQTTAERMTRLIQAIAAHAARISPTLVYARAQNNNHLLTEAAGLYTAGLALPEHPSARHWQQLGWRMFNQAIREQISSDGTYTQHSTNYHRLMLQIALWVSSLLINSQTPQVLPPESRDRLSAATRWLMALLDPVSGRAPNLGPNDGAYILPLSSSPVDDFRPVIQAAASAYLGECPYPSGPWDEMSLWFKAAVIEGENNIRQPETQPTKAACEQPLVLRSSALDSWAYLRAARFTARPGHADQLHLDLWWRGLNVALDPGTYLYNAPPPWDNSLARTEVHNTITLDNKDQMTRAGRFLWLDWAQAEIVSCQTAQDNTLISLTAQQDGYLGMGALHKRRVVSHKDGWWVRDELLPCVRKPKGQEATQARLHWLLPDWPWEMIHNEDQGGKMDIYCLRVKSPHGWLSLQIEMTAAHLSQGQTADRQIQLTRAGQLVYGSGQVCPTWGWISPTYNLKLPALSFAIYQSGRLPLSFNSRWIFP